jgi:APA family basic amino acid/polyamine antiporter
MPIGILGSLAATTVIYILVALVLTGVVSYTRLGVAEPIALGVDALGSSLYWLRPVIKIGAIAGLSSVVLILIYGQSRIFFTMANDHLLPSVFARLHERYRTPHAATIVTGIAVMAFSGLFPIGILGEMVSIGTLLAFVIVCIGVIVLRYTKPQLHRPFRTPLMPFVPIAGALVAFIQMLALPFDTWMRLIGWMVIGFFVYHYYGRYHARKHHATDREDGTFNPIMK